jgi:hypothetical protein
MDDRPEQRPTEQPEQTPQHTARAPVQPAVAVRRRAVYPPRPSRRRGCRRTAIIVLLTFVVSVVLVVGGVVYLLFRQPERLLEALRVVTPKYYPIALAVEEDNEVHVFYRVGSLVPDVERRAHRFDLAWRTTAFHGTVADEVPTRPTPIEPFTGAVRFKDTLWLLADGGYRTWSGDAWSELTPKPEWLRPQACVAGGKLWVFYEDRDRVLSVAATADGKTWQLGGLQQKLPSLDEAEKEANRFLGELRARFRVAVVNDKPYVFWYDPARKRLSFRFYDTAWSLPHSAGGTALFAVAAAGPLLCLFDVPAWRENEELGYDEAVVTMRTFDGQRWSEPADLDVVTTLCLDASSVGDDIWLFTSGYKSLSYTIYSDGNWGLTVKLPKPESAAGPAVEQQEKSE